jgi:hypothetical protein
MVLQVTEFMGLFGERGGTRTNDPMIKSYMFDAVPSIIEPNLVAAAIRNNFMLDQSYGHRAAQRMFAGYGHALGQAPWEVRLRCCFGYASAVPAGSRWRVFLATDLTTT